MRDIGAANVESPGDVLRIRNNECIGAQSGQFNAHEAQFLGRAFAGELDVAQGDGAMRRGWPFVPQSVDRIFVECDERRAGLGAGGFQFVGALARVQPRIETDFGAALEVFLQPLIGRTIDQMLNRKHRAVGLRLHLHGVAAIDEQHGAVEEHDSRAGRTGEAGEPGEALLAGGEIFVLLPVGARHHQPVEAAALQLGAQRRHPPGAGGRFARIIEGLEAGFKHGFCSCGTIARFRWWATQACSIRPAGQMHVDNAPLGEIFASA